MPHFEKMLYDNALLAMAYLETYQATKNEKYADVARQIFTYVMRDMTSTEGGFYSAEDADSEGTEGKFYVWSPDEVEQVLGEADGRLYSKLFDITGEGNFEGKSIPNLINSGYSHEQKEFAEQCREKLFAYREKRVHPYKDDKILTGWNGLMIAALAMGGRILGSGEFTKAAENAFHFAASRLVRKDNRLMARYRDGDAAYPGYVDDYSFIVWGLVELYEATFKPEYLQKALSFNDDLLKLFWDEEKGGLFVYGSDGEELITRPKEIYDGATPSGNSVSALNFLRLARLTGRHELEDRAHQLFRTFGSAASGYPRGYSFFMTAFMFSKAAAKEIVIVGNEGVNAKGLLDVVKERFDPFSVSLFYSKENESIRSIVPFLENYTTVNGQSAVYVCENFACSRPVISKGDLRELLQ